MYIVMPTATSVFSQQVINEFIILIRLLLYTLRQSGSVFCIISVTSMNGQLESATILLWLTTQEIHRTSVKRSQLFKVSKKLYWIKSG